METRSLRRIVCGKRAEYADWVSLELQSRATWLTHGHAAEFVGQTGAQFMPNVVQRAAAPQLVSDRGMEGRCPSTRATE